MTKTKQHSDSLAVSQQETTGTKLIEFFPAALKESIDNTITQTALNKGVTIIIPWNVLMKVGHVIEVALRSGNPEDVVKSEKFTITSESEEIHFKFPPFFVTFKMLVVEYVHVVSKGAAKSIYRVLEAKKK